MAAITYEFKGDTSDLKKSILDAINDIHGIAEDANATAEEASAAMQNLGKDITDALGVEGASALVDAAKDVEKQLDKTAEQAKDLQDAMKQAISDKDVEQVAALAMQMYECQQKTEALTDTAASLKEAMKGANQAMQANPSGLEKADQAVTSLWSKFKKGIGIEKIKEGINMLPGPIKSVVGGFGQMLGAMQKIIATPIGAVLSVVVGAINAVSAAFTGSQAGQRKYAELTGKISGAMSILKEKAIETGSAIIESFENGTVLEDLGKKVKGLGESIKTDIQNRLEGVKNLWKSINEWAKQKAVGQSVGNNEAAQKAAEAAMAALKQTTSGKTEQQRKEEEKAAEEEKKRNEERIAAMGALEVREFDLHNKRTAWMAQEAKLDNKIAAARLDMYESTNNADKLKATQEAQELINQKYAQQIAFAQEEYNIIKERNSLFPNAQKDLDAEREALAKLIGLEGQRDQEKMRFARAAQSIVKAQTEAERQAGLQEVALRQQVEEKKAEVMEEGLERELTIIRNNAQARKNELNKQKSDWLKENEETTGKAELTNAQKNYLEVQMKLVDDEENVNTAKALFDKYATEAQKYFKNHAIFEADIAKLKQTEGGEQFIQGAREQQQQASLDYLQSEKKHVIEPFIEQIADYTYNQLEAALTKAETSLADLQAAGGADPEAVALAEAKLAALRQQMKNYNKDAEKKVRLDKWNALNDICKQGAEDFVELGNAMEGTAGEAMKVLGEILTTASGVINSITNVVTGAITLQTRAAENGAEAIKTVEKASVILAIIGAVIQAAMAIAKMFKGSDYMEQAIEQASKLNEKIQETLRSIELDTSGTKGIFGEDNWAKLQQNIANTNKYYDMFTATVANFGIVSQEVMNAASQGFKGDIIAKQLEQSNEAVAQQKQNLSDVESMMETLQNAQYQTRHSTWVSDAKYSSLKELGADLEVVYKDADKQIIDMHKTMAKVTSLAESDFMNAYQLGQTTVDAIKDIKTAWETYQQAFEGVKEQLSSYFDGITSALADSIKAGFMDGSELGAEEFRKNVREAMDDMVMDLMISKAVGSVFDEAASTISDEILQKGDNVDVTSLANIVMDATDKAYANAQKVQEVWEEYNKAADERGYKLDTEADEGTLSGAIQGASQESIDLLSGYCNAVRVQQVESIEVQRNQLIEMSGIRVAAETTSRVVTEIRDTLQLYLTTDTERATGI